MFPSARGKYDADGKEQPSEPNEHIYYYQEDPKGIIEHAEPDLQEPEPSPAHVSTR